MSLKMERSKELALPVLLSAPTYSKAAQQLGVATSTIYEWLKDDEFRNALDDLRRSILADSIARLKGYVSLAVDVLAETMTDPDPKLRLKAATTILDSVNKSTGQQAGTAGSLEDVLSLIRERQGERERQEAAVQG
jgi:hypothetical protein